MQIYIPAQTARRDLDMYNMSTVFHSQWEFGPKHQSVFYLNEKHFSKLPGEMKFEFLYHVMGNTDGPLVVFSHGPVVLSKHLHQPSAVILLRLPK